ncbi:uncharacterized protein C12orf45 homolog isoform X1 [Takifugu flavidus]|uniref:uncharacterized protein C12orf45 homolog isoform X1 n=1 Tax=Takifugu flavidus TaxID=433684 RepID=UPI0025444BF1|nr:uncharacterized protein C12orf45 homolog isoform X1 [Takifugu flavidus]
MELTDQKETSEALLRCGSGQGLTEKLLLKPKAGSSLQTQRVPRSNVLERLQTFLPQMAEANEKLRQQMEEAPAGLFDIEQVDQGQRVIEMDVALVELSGSESDWGGEEETSSSEDESEEERTITEKNLRLPSNKGGKQKANIQLIPDVHNEEGLSRVQVWTLDPVPVQQPRFHRPGLEMLNWCFPQQQSCLKIEPQLLPLFKNLFTKRLICALKHEFSCRLALLLSGPVKPSRSQQETARTVTRQQQHR